MADLQGYQFSPGLQQRFRQSLNSPTGASQSPLPNQVSQALQVLSLHLPRNLGGNPIMPDALLRGPHGFTPDASIRSQVTGSQAPPSGLPTAPPSMAPSAPGTPAGVGNFGSPVPPPDSSPIPPPMSPAPPAGPSPTPGINIPAPSYPGPRGTDNPFGGNQPIDPGPGVSFGGSAPPPNIGFAGGGVTDPGPTAPPLNPPGGGGMQSLLDFLLKNGGGAGGGGFSGGGFGGGGDNTRNV